MKFGVGIVLYLFAADLWAQNERADLDSAIQESAELAERIQWADRWEYQTKASPKDYFKIKEQSFPQNVFPPHYIEAWIYLMKHDVKTSASKQSKNFSVFAMDWLIHYNSRILLTPNEVERVLHAFAVMIKGDRFVYKYQPEVFAYGMKARLEDSAFLERTMGDRIYSIYSLLSSRYNGKNSKEREKMLLRALLFLPSDRKGTHQTLSAIHGAEKIEEKHLEIHQLAAAGLYLNGDRRSEVLKTLAFTDIDEIFGRDSILGMDLRRRLPPGAKPKGCGPDLRKLVD